MFNCDEGTSRLIRLKVTHLVRHRAFCGADRDDIEQELKSELISKWSQFDAARGCRSTFVSRILQNKVASLIRAKTAKKRNCGRKTCSLNRPVADESGGNTEFGETLKELTVNDPFESKTDLRLDVNAVLNSLPDELRYVACRLKHKCKKAVRLELGLSRCQFSKLITQIRRRFEDANLEEYF